MMEDKDREVIRRDTIAQVLLQHHGSTAVAHIATLINDALNNLDRVEQAGMSHRTSYDRALRWKTAHGNVKLEDDPAMKRTRQILEVPCPTCGSGVGNWCEYATGALPGSNPWLHVNRMRDADKLRVENARQRLGEK